MQASDDAAQPDEPRLHAIPCPGANTRCRRQRSHFVVPVIAASWLAGWLARGSQASQGRILKLVVTPPQKELLSTV